MEIKQKSDYYNTWRMYSSYQKYMRGCKEYDSIKKWYNGNLTKPQLDKAMEVIAAFKESFIDTIDKIQNERLKNDLISTYEDISQIFTIKGLNPDEIENYIKAPNKDDLVDSLIEKSNYRIENIQTQKNEIDVMDAMYQKIKTGFKSNLKELTERENNYLANLDLGLYKDGKDQKLNYSLNLDYIKVKYGSKAYKLIDKGIGAQFNKKKLAAALPAMKEFFNYKITGLGNNEYFYSSNTQYGAIKTQIEGHLRIKGLTSADVSYVKKNNVSADNIIGKVKVNRTVECIKSS